MARNRGKHCLGISGKVSIGTVVNYSPEYALNSQFPETRYYYAYYLLVIGKYKEAIQHLIFALKYDPDNVQINSTYGFALSISGDFEAAKRQLEKTLTLEPNSQATQDALFWNYFGAGNTKKAKSVLNEYESGILHSPATQILFYHSINQKKELENWLKKLEGKNQKNESYYRNASIAYLAIGDMKKGVSRLEQFYKEKIGFVMVLSHPAWKSFRESPKFYKYKKRLKLLNPPILSLKDTDVSIDEIVFHSNTSEKLTIDAKKLIFIESQNIYCNIVWEERGHLREKSLRISLNQILEQSINPNLFRCHKSFVVNRTRPYSLLGNRKSMKIVPKGYTVQIPVSRAKTAYIHDYLNIIASSEE